MRIAVVGAGSMGSAFGGLLTSAGHDVWLVDPWQEHVNKMRTDGLSMEGIGGERVVVVKATTDPADVGTVDLAIIFVKSTETPWAAHAALSFTGAETTVLTLQNGLGNREIIGGSVGEDKVLSGLTFAGAQLLGPGRVRFTSDADTYLGEMDGTVTPRVQRIAQAFSEAGLHTCVSETIASQIWGKLLINAVGNAACALTGYTIGGLMDHPSSRELVRVVAEETAEVARALGVTLPYDDPVEKMHQNCERSGRAKPSMLQDIEKGRRTEIDFINGAIAREADRIGVPAPYNKLLTLLVTMIESSPREQKTAKP